MKLKHLFSDTFIKAEKEAAVPALKEGKPDWKIIVILVLACLSLTFNEYLPKILKADLYPSNPELSRLGKWVLVLFVFYFIIPALIIRFWFREKLTDYGLRLKDAFNDYYLYVIMLAVMVPLVWFFSQTPGFQAKYPFYDLRSGEALFPGFLIWEVLYLAQFFALEFFFRGFMVLGLKHRFGFYSVFIMTVPYCMIHFGKPLPETLAAILAGIVLGTLSLKSRSILLGVAIHYSVGLLMDLAALYHRS